MGKICILIKYVEISSAFLWQYVNLPTFQDKNTALCQSLGQGEFLYPDKISMGDTSVLRNLELVIVSTLSTLK